MHWNYKTIQQWQSQWWLAWSECTRCEWSYKCFHSKMVQADPLAIHHFWGLARAAQGRTLKKCKISIKSKCQHQIGVASKRKINHSASQKQCLVDISPECSFIRIFLNSNKNVVLKVLSEIFLCLISINFPTRFKLPYSLRSQGDNSLVS